MKILLFSPQSWPVDDALLMPQLHQIERVQGQPLDLQATVQASQPDVLLLGGLAPHAALLNVLENLSAQRPQMTIALHLPQVTAPVLLDLMRAGVRDVLADTSAASLTPVLERAVQKALRAQPSKSKVIGIITAKDGDWGSCVSANLGYALSELAPAKVLLMDLSIPFGDLDMYLTSQTDMKDLVDVSSEADRMDSSLLESLVHPLRPNLDLIVSPTSFEKVLRVQTDQIKRLVQVAASHYGHVVLDMGTALDKVSLSVLDQVDEICVVASSILPSIRRLSQILKLLQTLDYDEGRISVVVNRFDERGPISRQEMEKVIGKSIRCHLALDHAGMQNSLLKGKSIMELRPDSKFAEAVRQLAAQISGAPTQHKKSLWQRLRMK